MAEENIAGELMDLEAGGLLDESLDPIEVSDAFIARYRSLWSELTAPEAFEPGDRWRVEARIRRLNESARARFLASEEARRGSARSASQRA